MIFLLLDFHTRFLMSHFSLPLLLASLLSGDISMFSQVEVVLVVFPVHTIQEQCPMFPAVLPDIPLSHLLQVLVALEEFIGEGVSSQYMQLLPLSSQLPAQDADGCLRQ
jgi:hypothetical protein